MKPTKTNNGYLKVRICIYGRIYNRNIHRMVAESFIPNLYNKKEINHIDGNKHNNSVNNLEWCTRRENAEHAYINDLFGGKSENFPTSTLTNNQVIEICELLANTNMAQREISKKIGCSYKIINDIVKRKTWKEISESYDFSKRNTYRLTENDAIIICELLSEGYPSKYIASQIGCNIANVKDIKRHKTWTHISNNYKF